jgi:hypothetical protein
MATKNSVAATVPRRRWLAEARRPQGGGRTIRDEVGRLACIEAYTTEEALVQRHMTAFGSPQPQALGETISQLHATQKLRYEQMKEFWDQHQTFRQETGTTFEQSTGRQEQLYQELIKQRNEMAAHARQLEMAVLRIPASGAAESGVSSGESTEDRAEGSARGGAVPAREDAVGLVRRTFGSPSKDEW